MSIPQVTVSHVVFIILSAIALIGALGVVTTRNLFRAALFLVLSFIGVAGFYILLEAEFLAMVQILVYVGAIAILIIFAIMLSQRLMAPGYKASNEQWGWALVSAVALFAVDVIRQSLHVREMFVRHEIAPRVSERADA